MVYGYRRDADRFADQRRLPRADVLSVTQGVERLRGQSRRIVLVDTAHILPQSQALQWHDVKYVAEMINQRFSGESGKTETIWWTS